MDDRRTQIAADLMGHMADHDHRHRTVQNYLQDAWLAGALSAARVSKDEELVTLVESIAFRILQQRD